MEAGTNGRRWTRFRSALVLGLIVGDNVGGKFHCRDSRWYREIKNTGKLPTLEYQRQYLERPGIYLDGVILVGHNNLLH